MDRTVCEHGKPAGIYCGECEANLFKRIEQLQAEVERLMDAIGERCVDACEESLDYCMKHCPITKALEGER